MEECREEGISSGKGLETGREQNSTIHNRFKLGTTQMAVKSRMDKE